MSAQATIPGANNKALHTPGPWGYEPIPADAHTDPDIMLDESFRFWIVGAGGDVLALVEADPHGDAEAEANARLMAAAPELVEACELFTRAAHETRDLLNDRGLPCPASIALAAEKARNAIAKAEGRS